jgi:hypothetical protein
MQVRDGTSAVTMLAQAVTAAVTLHHAPNEIHHNYRVTFLSLTVNLYCLRIDAPGRSQTAAFTINEVNKPNWDVLKK